MLKNLFDGTSDGRVVLNALFLKRLRQKRGLSQDALAQLCLDSHFALSLASIKRAEAGKAVSYRTARHLAAIYHTELDLLMLAPAKVNACAETLPAPTIYENASARAPILDRRLLPAAAVSVIFFSLESNDFNASAHKHVLESGARTIANQNGTQLAVVFGAPAYRCTDAFAALRCAISLKSCAATRARLILRRRAVAEVFAHATNVDANVDAKPGNADVDGSIYLETALAMQLSVLAHFEARDLTIPGCRRFLRLNNTSQNLQL